MLLELGCLHIVSMIIVIFLIRLWFSLLSLGRLDILLRFLVLGSGWFVRSHLVVECRWPLVNDGLMHLHWGLMLWLGLRLSRFWSRCGLLRMSLLVTFPFFFHNLVVRFRLMITWLRHMESSFVKFFLFILYCWLMMRLLWVRCGLLLLTLDLFAYDNWLNMSRRSFLMLLCFYLVIF